MGWLADRVARASAPRADVMYLSVLDASPAGHEDLRACTRVGAALASGSNPFTVVRPSILTEPDRGESRLAARLGYITRGDVAEILGRLTAAPLDRRVHAPDNRRR